MTALALKAWYGLLMPNRKRGLEIVRMEFRRFLHAIVLLPAQIIRTGRRIVYRLLSWNEWRFFPHLGTAAIDVARVAGRVNPRKKHGRTVGTYKKEASR